jgi:excisionase family DNA binding protein
VEVQQQRAFYSIKDLMSRWDVSRATIYREIDRGRLRRRHIGGQVRFASEDVASYEHRVPSN